MKCELSFLTAPLSVEVEPKQQVVDYGRPATFKCNYQGNPVKVWKENYHETLKDRSRNLVPGDLLDEGRR